MPAPIRPPASACDELEGSPHHQVSRSQPMAPIKAATTNALLMIEACTTPLPIVCATCSGKIRKATKLKKAVQTTAQNGLSTRVETMVAIELAASWKPLQ